MLIPLRMKLIIEKATFDCVESLGNFYIDLKCWCVFVTPWFASVLYLCLAARLAVSMEFSLNSIIVSFLVPHLCQLFTSLLSLWKKNLKCLHIALVLYIKQENIAKTQDDATFCILYSYIAFFFLGWICLELIGYWLPQVMEKNIATTIRPRYSLFMRLPR